MTKHRMSKTPEYLAWRRAKQRCSDPKDKHWKDYGGRGIKMAPVWMENFEVFFAELGLKPTPLHSLDRKETNGHYAPGNCRWATPQEQAANRRFCHHVTVGGQEMTIQEAARMLEVAPMTLRHRVLRLGMTVEAATQVGYLREKKNGLYLTHQGETHSAAEWAHRVGLKPRTLRNRLYAGVPLERALQPVMPPL